MPIFVIIGWIGAITFVVAYFLLSIKVCSADKAIYHILNAVGGLCLVVNSIYLDDTPNFFVNIVWMGIALYSVGRILFFKKRLSNFKK